jgi:WD40 repeat protein
MALGYAPDGATLLSSSRDTTTRWWDMRRGETLIVRPGDSSTGHIAFSPDGTRVGMSTHQWRGTIMQLIRPAVVREIPSAVRGNRGSLVGALDFTRDGSLLAVATWKDVRVIESSTGRAIGSFPVAGEKLEECSAIFAPDGTALYISSAARGLRRHRRARDGSFGESESLSDEKDWLVADITADGAQLVLVNRKQSAVKITDANGSAGRVFTKHPNAMFTALSPDRKWLATQGTGRGESAKIGARVWSLGDETLAHEFPGGPLGAVAFSADGRWFASSGMERFHLVPVGQWDAPIRLPENIGKAGALVSFAADGELVAITTDDKTYLFHPATGVERGLIGSPSGEPSTARARLSPDGKRLAVMWDDGSFDLWDLAQLKQELAGLGM